MKRDKLDILFSEYIRRRAITRVHGCERCLQGKADFKQLQCSHFHGRSKRSVRFDEDNAAGICAGCHMYLTSNPHEHTEWFKNYLGEDKFDMLLKRAQTPQKLDVNAIYLYLKERLKEE